MAKDFEAMEDSNRSANASIHDVSDPARRIVLRGGLGAVVGGLLAPLAGVSLVGCAGAGAAGSMLLAGVPGGVGDGAKATLSYAGGTVNVDTYVGKKPTADTLRRFLVGPKDCEITGITETPDGKAVFVNIQHPGETIVAANVADPTKYLSHWPGNAGYQATAGNATSRPRSSTIVITKNDGGRIGT